MTLDLHADGIPADQQDAERPTDPRPAWERIAYAWLEREVDARPSPGRGHPGPRGQRGAGLRP